MKPLPDKPSELIRVALDDLEACEKDPRYEIAMGFWHLPVDNSCSVCLAGSVMAQSLDVPINVFAYPEDQDVEIQNKLEALNDFRVGDIYYGLRRMGIEPNGLVPTDYPITPYYKNPEQFKLNMRAMADMLEGHGL